MSVANLQALRARTMLSATAEQREARLAAQAEAKEKAEERVRLLSQPLPGIPQWTYEKFKELTPERRRLIYSSLGLLKQTPIGPAYDGTGDFYRDINTNQVYYLLFDFLEDSGGSFRAWSSRVAESGDVYDVWEAELPGRSILVGNYNPETGVFLRNTAAPPLLKWERPTPRLADAESPPEPAKKVSPQVAADKLTLKMAESVPFNRENLRIYYRAQALRYHPDKNPGKDTTEMFKKVQAAYERLLLEASE